MELERTTTPTNPSKQLFGRQPRRAKTSSCAPGRAVVRTDLSFIQAVTKERTGAVYEGKSLLRKVSITTRSKPIAPSIKDVAQKDGLGGPVANGT